MPCYLGETRPTAVRARYALPTITNGPRTSRPYFITTVTLSHCHTAQGKTLKMSYYNTVNLSNIHHFKLSHGYIDTLSPLHCHTSNGPHT